jgi:hypothetical protein
MSRLFIGFSLWVGFPAGAVMAHHGAFEYDLDTVLRYEGVVVEHLWRNPHNVLVLETRSEAGELMRLEIEGGGPSALRPVGVAGDMFVVGDRVTAVVSPSRRFPSQSAFGHEIVKKDGSVVPLGRRSTGARTTQISETASTIFGTWTPPWEAFIELVSSRASWVLTDEGRKASESYSPALSSQAQCIAVAAPWLMVHTVVHEIEQLDDRLVIRTDWLGGVERTIYVDGRAHPPVTEQFQQGHSVGRWEDETLVVDTRNFAERIYAGLASSADKHLVERFSLAEGGTSLNYSFVLEDPEYLAEPLSRSFTWDYRPDLEPSEIECDLELAERYLREFP